MQIRTFNEENLDKVDRLMKYLESNNLLYTAHWVGVTASVVEIRRKKAEDAGKKFDPAKIPLLQVTWFG